jgi:hypothetical protein
MEGVPLCDVILEGEDAGHGRSLFDPGGVLSWALGHPPPTQALKSPSASESLGGKGSGSPTGRGWGCWGGGQPAVRRTGGRI